MVDVDLAYRPAGELAVEIAAGRLSPVEVVANALDRIEQVNPSLNCFCIVPADRALDAARAAEAAVARGDDLGPLHGVPMALKDTTPTAGIRTTLGSYAFERWVPDHDAAIARSLQRAGAILVGKTTTPEFAHTLFTDSPLWGATRNPWDLTRSPGGSSGGSAAAVAAGCVPLAEGSDMGGSVRIPAAWCGVVGLKPGLGRIPMDVLPSVFDSISHHGPLARSVDDARLFLAATQGPDESDIQSLTTPLELSRPVGSSVEGLRLALSVDLGFFAVEPAVADAVRATAAALEAAGAIVDQVDLGLDPHYEQVWVELWGVFMAAYYGDLVAEHRERMDPDVLALIGLGERLSAVQYKRLEVERTRMWQRVSAVLADHDAILCPTMATGPVNAAKSDPRRPFLEAPEGGHLGHDMTKIWNLVPQCPALSVPCGFDGDGLPIGFQIVGRRWREDTVLGIGATVEGQLGPRPRPPL